MSERRLTKPHRVYQTVNGDGIELLEAFETLSLARTFAAEQWRAGKRSLEIYGPGYHDLVGPSILNNLLSEPANA